VNGPDLQRIDRLLEWFPANLEGMRPFTIEELVLQGCPNELLVNIIGARGATARERDGLAPRVKAMELARSALQDLITSIEQHHATNNCPSTPLWATANTHFRVIELLRVEIEKEKQT
jgi:hypothetical protein